MTQAIAGTATITPEEILTAKLNLESRRKNLIDQLSNLISRGLPEIPKDSADISMITTEQINNHGIEKLARDDLGRVEAALIRLKEGKWGFCTGCGCEIPLVRRKLHPEAGQCVSCGEKNSRSNRFHRR